MERTGIFYMKKFLAEFKEFAMRGNVMDLAVGVIIGGFRRRSRQTETA